MPVSKITDIENNDKIASKTIDKDAMDEIAHAANANDEQSIMQLMLSGKACSISNGESGVMVHGSFSGIQVRLSGGTCWWVPTNTVKVDTPEK